MDLGLWAEAVADLEHAARVDPQSAEVIGDLGAIYTRLRRYREARAALERARLLRPSSLSLVHARARLAAMEGDLEGIRQVFRSMEEIVGRRRVVAYVALREDLIWALDDEARRAVLELTPDDLDGGRADWALALAQVHWLRGDTELARAYGDRATQAFTSLLADYGGQVDRHQLVALRGLSQAYAGRTDEAMAEGLRAEAQQPKDQNTQGSCVRYVVARIHVLAGRPEEAIDRLVALADEPGLRSGPLFRIDPNMAPIRAHPRFVWR
ncbi:hypothetical protein BH24GEM1_BH24GEM1_10130 [soil metagenome]